VEIALYALGGVLLVAGLAGLVLPVLPGSLLLLAGVVVIAWAGGFALLGWPTIAVATVLALAMWAVDHAASLLGAKAFGASRWALLGGAIGVVVGLFFGLPGIILGPAVGAVGFELWKGRDLRKAANAGAGVLVGFVAGTVVKIALAFVLVGAVAIGLLA
jgi:uncharacterized protein YqgC (DUF456 family)